MSRAHARDLNYRSLCSLLGPTAVAGALLPTSTLLHDVVMRQGPPTAASAGYHRFPASDALDNCGPTPK